MPENSFRKRVFYLLLLAKIIILLFLGFEWQTGGYATHECVKMAAILLPLFTIYTSVLFKEMVQHRYVTSENSPLIKRELVGLTYGVLIAYVMVLIWVITLRPKGVIEPNDLSQLQAIIAIIESVFGAYISPLVFVFDKK